MYYLFIYPTIPIPSPSPLPFLSPALHPSLTTGVRIGVPRIRNFASTICVYFWAVYGNF